jgi:hypothetical protein
MFPRVSSGPHFINSRQGDLPPLRTRIRVPPSGRGHLCRPDLKIVIRLPPCNITRVFCVQL